MPSKEFKQRMASYAYLFFGIPLGYAGSYFIQPWQMRMSVPFIDYLSRAGQLLAPSVFPGLAGSESFQRTLCSTAWLGVGAGVAIVGVMLIIASKLKPKAEK